MTQGPRVIPFPSSAENEGPQRLPDAEARARIETDLDTTLFVEAAAGTGKTTALVSRMMQVLRSGRGTLEGMVAVTFTDKAAGEMKLRLRGAIEEDRRGAMPARERHRLEGALQQLEVAHIGTIHAFCADLLRERPVEAGVDPLFEVAAGEDQVLLLNDAFDGWFETALADPPEGLRRVLRRQTGPGGSGPRESLRAAAARLVEHRDFDAPWRREPLDRASELDAIMPRLEELALLADRGADGDDWLARGLGEISRWVRENRLRERVRGRDHDALEASLRRLARRKAWRWKGYGRRYGPDLDRSAVIAQRDEVKAALDQVLDDAEADLAACLREDLRPVIDAYDAVKARQGKLDFLDLLLRARDLVAGRPEVRRELQGRFTHFFVDEFQDTDPLQVELLMLLCADDPGEVDHRAVRPVPGKLFIVGDPKQSIYRFRRADVALYEEARNRLKEAGAEVLHLTTSFRGVPSIQAAVNGAFEPAMEGDGTAGQAAYVGLQQYRSEAEGRPAVIALPVPRPYGPWGRVTGRAVDASLPGAVGAFVRWLVRESGWTFKGPGPDGAPADLAIEARHVCILFKRFTSFGRDVTRPYVDALEERRVPHVLVGGRSFHAREEVLALRNALTAVEWPDDTLRVFATLRGPLFALGDDTLLAYRAGVGPLHPLAPVDAGSLRDPDRSVAEALAVLGALHRGRNRRPIAATVGRLLAAVRAHAGIAIWRNGEQALANCLRVADRARRFEDRGAASFRAFVETLEEEAESGDVEQAPIVEEGTEGVRIMTVHKAKGLEFPVVILADPTAPATHAFPTHHLEPQKGLWAETLCGAAPHDLLDHVDEERAADEAEATRVAYVAATRARDLLVVPVAGDGPEDGWLAVLNRALYPDPGRRQHPGQAAGCPPFGPDSVLDRPGKARRRSADMVRPGAHVAAAGNPVVWWDPAALDLSRRLNLGLRQQQILEADDEGVAVEAGVRHHEEWQALRRKRLEAGRTPERRVMSVTAMAHEEGEDQAGAAAGHPVAEAPAARPRVDVVRVEGTTPGRPHGVAFGNLVHAALAVVPFDADVDAVAAVVAVQARRLGAGEEEEQAAVATVAAALRHDVLRAAAGAASTDVRRECPVVFDGGDGLLLEGIVDLAFRCQESGATAQWTVVDFKTDPEVEDHLDAYSRQLGAYVRGVAAATGEAARGVLLVV